MIFYGIDNQTVDFRITNYNFERTPTEEEFKLHAELYAKCMILFKKYSEHIDRVTFWALDDSTSWLADLYPTMFNEDFTPKLAFFAVADPEGFLAGNIPLTGLSDVSGFKIITLVFISVSAGLTGYIIKRRRKI